MSSADTSGTVHAHRLGPWIGLVAAVSCAAAIAACGGSGSGPSVVGGTTATGNSSPVALSRCMRAHRLTNFPDPKQGSGGLGFPEGLLMSSDGTLTVDGASFAGPALKTAEQACKRFLPGGSGPPPPVSPRQKKAALANAQCMRTHGVPNFPDPTFPTGGGVAITGSGVNPQSPAFKQAAAACGGPARRIG
ncbi:MAG TPA: hypothetical protein VIK04_11010 [Solirubrobacteraceae bacterium]